MELCTRMRDEILLVIIIAFPTSLAFKFMGLRSLFIREGGRHGCDGKQLDSSGREKIREDSSIKSRSTSDPHATQAWQSW